jgi:hypothetical protein
MQLTYARTGVAQVEWCDSQKDELQVRGDLLEHGALGLCAHEPGHHFAVLEQQGASGCS